MNAIYRNYVVKNTGVSRFAMGSRAARVTAVPFVLRYLATMIELGLPVVPGLRERAARARGYTRTLSLGLAKRLEGGCSLPDAMGADPCFEPFLVEVVRAGVRSGNASSALVRCAEYLEATVTLQRKTRVAMMYPVVVFVIAVFGGAYLCITALPVITDIFRGLEVPLPATTRCLVLLAAFVERSATHVALCALVILLLGVVSARTGTSRRAWDRLVLLFPILRGINRNLFAARFSRVLCESLRGGLPIDIGFELSARATGNTFIRDRVLKAIPRALSGAPIRVSLNGTSALPQAVFHLLAMGEAEGNLVEVLREIAKTCEGSADHGQRVALGLLEPALLLVVAGLVLFLVTSISLPIYLLLGYL